MEKDTLARLEQLPPGEARANLVSLVRETGTAAIDVLRAALGAPALAVVALDALGELPAQEAWDLLEQIDREAGTQQLRKAARRAKHRLRSRGFRPATPRQEGAPIAVEQAQASFFDTVGAQFLRLVRPAPLGMARYAGFVVSAEGLLACDYVLASRADLETYLAAEGERFGESLVEMGLAYLARRVRQAVERSRERREALPEDYVEAKALLEDAPEDISPAGLQAVDPTGVSLAEAHRVFRHRSMQHWLLPPEQLSPYARDWLRMLEVQPLRTDEGLPNLGAVQARGHIAGRILSDLVDEDARRRLAEQLQEQARLFAAMGETDLAAATARCGLGLAQSPTADSPFLQALVEKSMEFALQEARQEQEAAAQGPWMSVSGQGGPLWVPRPSGDAAEEEQGEEGSTPRLWLPGQ